MTKILVPAALFLFASMAAAGAQDMSLMTANVAGQMSLPSATGNATPPKVVADSRRIADYSIQLQADQWVSGPSFVTGEIKWYLQAKIIGIGFEKFATPGNSPFKIGGDILLIPYCSQGKLGIPGGPGHGCAEFVSRKLQIWGLLADMHARKNRSGNLLIQAENLLDAAFIQ